MTLPLLRAYTECWRLALVNRTADDAELSCWNAAAAAGRCSAGGARSCASAGRQWQAATARHPRDGVAGMHFLLVYPSPAQLVMATAAGTHGNGPGTAPFAAFETHQLSATCAG